MTTLPEYLEAHGHALFPVDDPSLLDLSPGGGWSLVEQNHKVRNVAIWADPALLRDDFQPTIVESVARITPTIDPDTVFDRLDDTAAMLPGWQTRASSRSTDAGGRSISDTLGSYCIDRRDLTASSIVTVWNDDQSTVMHQVVVTTFPDQLAAHAAVLSTPEDPAATRPNPTASSQSEIDTSGWSDSDSGR